MVFQGYKFCPHCGAVPNRTTASRTELPCPKCKQSVISEIQLGHTPVGECGKCHGLWVDATVFDQICTDREKQSAVLGSASETFKSGQKKFEPNIRYVPCPVCRQLMHRLNFARCSGILVDVCRGHGTWFDRDELQHIVEFIRRGGLDIARNKEKEELEAARRRLQAARNMPDRDVGHTHLTTFGEPDLFSIAGSIIKCVLD